VFRAPALAYLKAWCKYSLARLLVVRALDEVYTEVLKSSHSNSLNRRVELLSKYSGVQLEMTHMVFARSTSRP
jgi:hypothetical protein